MSEKCIFLSRHCIDKVRKNRYKRPLDCANMKTTFRLNPRWIFSSNSILLAVTSVLLCTSAHASFEAVPYFPGDKTETWEGFAGGDPLLDGQSIMGGYATISSFSEESGGMVIYDLGANSFDLDYGFDPGAKAGVSDGDFGLGLEGIQRKTTIVFTGPAYAFGSYWSVGNQGVSFLSSGWTVELLFDGGGTSGEMPLSYDASLVDGFVGLTWFGWRSDTKITKVIVSGNYVAMDGLQVETAPVPEPSTFIAGALLALPFGLQGLRYLRNRKRTV